VRTTGVIASGGRGNIICTDVAALLSLNCDLAFTKYSVLLRLCFSTWHSTQIRGFTSWLKRYVLTEKEKENRLFNKFNGGRRAEYIHRLISFINLHEIKGAIRRDKRDCTIPFKACQPDTLMELHIF